MDQELMKTTLEVDDRHWWYRGRRRVIRAELDRLPLAPGARVLDAGCGSGRTLVELVDYGETVVGVELDKKAVSVSRGRGVALEVAEGRLEELPWADGGFDLITCLDVIEHTPSDRVTLSELRRVCKPGGWLLVTVPAYQALWSAHDEANHHHRRYSRRSLREAALGAGWSVARVTSFNSLLLAPAVCVRLSQRARREASRWGVPRSGVSRSGASNGYSNDLEIGPVWLNGALEQPMRLEAGWLRGGRTLPAGLSLLAVLRKPWTDA